MFQARLPEAFRYNVDQHDSATSQFHQEVVADFVFGHVLLV
jgi:hypothetical protein